MKKRRYVKMFLSLSLALVLAMQVNAKTIYSEYELIGTTEEYKEDTELIKYTPVVMHRFYTLKETNEVFMPHYYESEDAPYKDTYIYNKIRTVSNEKNPLSIIYKRIAFKCSDCQNDVINKIEITNRNLLDEPLKTHVSIYEDDAITYDKKADLSSEKSIKLDYNSMIYFPRLLVEFDKNTNLALSIKYLNDNEVVYEQNLEPDDYLADEKLVLEVKIESDYERYMTDMELLTLDEAQKSHFHKFYTNEVLTYRFYNLKKEFYEDSRESYLSGYEYDEEDDYIVYDIYERSILEKTENKEETKEPEKPSKEETEEKDDKPADDKEVIENEPIKPVIKPEKEDKVEENEPPKIEIKDDDSELSKPNVPSEIKPVLPPKENEDSKLELPPIVDNKAPIITDEKTSELNNPETPPNLKTEETLIEENSKPETVKDIIYVPENKNNESDETDLDKELAITNEKIETIQLVNEANEINEKQSDTSASLALKIALRVLISIIVLFIIRKILCKVSVNSAK